MSTPRKITLTGDTGTDIRRITQAINFGEVILPFSAIGSTETAAAGAGAVQFGGLAVDRSVFRELLGADARWFVYAAGIANAGDANTLTIDLAYRDDAGVLTVLGQTVVSGAVSSKVAFGPFDVFATVGVPPGETIPNVLLRATKAAGVVGSLARWVIWLRLLPSKQ